MQNSPRYMYSANEGGYKDLGNILLLDSLIVDDGDVGVDVPLWLPETPFTLFSSLKAEMNGYNLFISITITILQLTSYFN